MISDIGYGLNAGAYLVLLLLLFTVRKSGLAKHLLVLASLTTMLWSVGHITVLFGELDLGYVISADAVKQFVWLLFIAGCLQQDFTDLWQVVRRPATLFILLVPTLTLLLPYFFVLSGTWLYLMHTVLALEVLILLEVVYRQAGEQKWAIKPLVLYLGAVNLLEFVTYANATMVNTIEPAYVAARGYVYVFLLPLLVIAIRRIGHWGIDIFISRDVVLHSSLLMVAGGYLFVMALIGYAINFIGGSWGLTVQVVLVALSLVLLVAVFMSSAFRTKIKVFITKHFFANQYDYRIEWVALTQALASSPKNLNDVYQNALRGLLNAVDYESGGIVKLQGNQVTPVCYQNHSSLNEHDLNILRQLASFCGSNHWLIDIDAYRIKPFDYDGLQLSRDDLEGASFQLAIPFFLQDELWGFALLTATSSERINLNWEVRDYLNAVSEQISTYVHHYEAAQAVAENAQFAAFNRMSAFVLHDLKNVLAQIDLILSNAQQHKHNPEFIDDTFETLEHTKARMDKMLRQLTEKKVVEPGAESVNKLSHLIESVIHQRCMSYLPLPKLEIQDETDVVVDQDKLSNVVYHLVSNAQQATSDDGSVVVSLSYEPGSEYQTVKIIDNGCGMDDTFIADRLFKPFDTTKGNAGMGIGAYDAKNYMTSIGGHLTVKSDVGVGTEFTLLFPIN